MEETGFQNKSTSQMAAEMLELPLGPEVLVSITVNISSVTRGSVSTMVFVPPHVIRMAGRTENVSVYMPPLPTF